MNSGSGNRALRNGDQCHSIGPHGSGRTLLFLSLFLFLYCLFLLRFLCTFVSQVASFTGWGCVECGLTATSSNLCPKCDAANHEIAGASCALIVLIFLLYLL